MIDLTQNKPKVLIYGISLVVGVFFFISSLVNGVTSYLDGVPFHWAFIGGFIGLYIVTGLIATILADNSIWND